MYECENCGKETDGGYIDCGRFYCNPTCAKEHAEWRYKQPRIR